MEMILAFAFTLLAVILGFLSTKRLLLARGVKKLIEIVTAKSKVAVNMNKVNQTEGAHKPESSSSISHEANEDYQEIKREDLAHNEMDEDGAFVMNSKHLSSFDSDGKPVKVKDFIRLLRENQENDMTEEEIEEEKRIQKQQLREIFQLMQSSENQYGIDSIDDMEEQMKLYAVGQ